MNINMDILTVFLYELKKYLRSSNSYILLLTGTLPITIFLAITAENFKINSLIVELEILQQNLIIGFIFYGYIVIIFFSIILFGNLIISENAYEFILVNLSRTKLLIGKLLASYILIMILILESNFSFILLLYSYNIPIPDISLFIKANLLLGAFSIFLTSIICFSCTFVIRLNLAPSLANYLSVFLFFVIPFIIYFSYFELGLFDVRMLQYSIHTSIQHIIYYEILSASKIDITKQVFESSIFNLFAISIICYTSSLILFKTSSISN